MKKFNPAKAHDEQLLDRFEESGDQCAFEELVRRHGPMVYATAARVLRREEDIEEAVQATMFALAKSARRLRRKAAIAGWLHKTAYTCSIEVLRANERLLGQAVRWRLPPGDRATQRARA